MRSRPGKTPAAGHFPGAASVAYGGRVKGAHGPLGIRLIDVGLAVVVLIAVEISVATGGGPGAAPLNALAYVLGGIMVLPVLLRHRWPRFELIACSVLLLLYYTFDRRDISPAPLLSLPLYDAAVAGYLVLAIVIPAVFMAIGLFVVGASTHQGLVSLAATFLPQIAVLFLAVTLGEVVRGRRALAAETAQRLQMAQEEREAEAARRVAEERLRIARDLHDTVAHSMATITVQAGSALHLLDGGDTNLRRALAAIRATSKEALAEMRATLGQLRTGTSGDPPTLAGRPGPAARAVRRGDRRRRAGDGRGRRRAAAAAASGGPGRLPDPAGVADQRAPARRAGGQGDRVAPLRTRRAGDPGHRRRRPGHRRRRPGYRRGRPGHRRGRPGHGWRRPARSRPPGR